MKELELYKFHEETFKPIYADLIAILGSKPEQIAFELEAALSHIAVAKTNDELYEKNIEKAYGHLQRASLDAVKIMWLEYRQRSEKIILDPDMRAFASKASESELITKFQKAEQTARSARKKELNNTGNDPSASISEYYEAAQLFSEIITLIDPEKVAKLTRFKSKYKTKEVVISFLVGVVSSGVVSFLLAK
ncbi:hypothetical protein [Cycloclasticus zancles]|uniref:Uncharacterized protein n=1 Tax=Cycloclasticus zancles 78-ME TaxID=1198232 RepID=S5T7W8_9GAMM|nr:hypothetical protein [Cycloclasticus zancles]AGS39699.1 hypothetical protein CYCME_1370 [Cycloclasticus zancles 78-ME]|tara:strand:+ start:8419 stop:8994 length:576 start_codon:yes stop_codon:yes gene_type:complete